MSEAATDQSEYLLCEVLRDQVPDLMFSGRTLARIEYPSGASIELFETEQGSFVVASVDVDQYGEESSHIAAVLDGVDAVIDWFDRRYGPMSRVFKNLARKCIRTRPELFNRAVEVVK
jgi:hypothetical protein